MPLPTQQQKIENEDQGKKKYATKGVDIIAVIQIQIWFWGSWQPWQKRKMTEPPLLSLIMWLVLGLHKQLLYYFFETLKKSKTFFFFFFCWSTSDLISVIFLVNVFLLRKIDNWDFDGPNAFKKYIDMANLINLSLSFIGVEFIYRSGKIRLFLYQWFTCVNMKKQHACYLQSNSTLRDSL